MGERLLDQRAAELLKLLVERYIRDGQPVGSRTLARAGRLQVSPATIRNVMADLDELGFVASPHTSAGRVPTPRGYRYFVEQLLEPERLEPEQQRRIAEALLRQSIDEEQLLSRTSELLSSLSSMAGIVTVPRRNRAVLRRIEFLPLSERRVLAVLVVNGREVQNRILEVDREYSADELLQMANAINERFAGQDLVSLRGGLVEDLRRVQDRMNRTLTAAVDLVERAVSAQDESADFILRGGSNLMGFEDLADIQRLRSLFDAFDRKRELLDLFERCLGAPGVQLFIGEESGYDILDDCSVITAPYRICGEVAGVLGVIGPTRMAYSRLIPLVQATAGALGKALSDAE